MDSCVLSIMAQFSCISPLELSAIEYFIFHVICIALKDTVYFEDDENIQIS